MAEKKRQCGTCRFFIQNETGSNGRCSHPDRAGADAELLLLRPTELACRTQWGGSLWQDPADESDPTAPKSPQQPTLPEPIAAQLQFDDEVTSVSIAGSKSSRSSFEDDVVDSGAVVTGMASWNDPVQDERLALLRRGNQDALAGARKRHLEKQARQRDLVPFADDDLNASSTDTSENFEAPEPVVARNRSFPADDFVEDERASENEEVPTDDEMVDEGLSRSPRMRKLLRENTDPKKDKAMHFSMPSEMRVEFNNPDNSDQFRSVPKLDPTFDLSLIAQEPTQKPVAYKMSATAASPAASSYQSRPMSQAREQMSENRLRNERAQRRLVAPLAENPPSRPVAKQTQPVTDRPRLTEAPSGKNASIDSIKSSPLRGYHPAARRLQQPVHQEAEPRPTQVYPSHTPHKQVEQPASRSWNQYEAAPPQTDRHQPQQNVTLQRESQRPSEQSERRPQQVSNQDQTENRPQRKPYIPLQQVQTPYEWEPIEISPSVVRSCKTCASYRPGDEPGRGTCANEFAGPKQRMVNEEHVACKRAFGSFWVPADSRVWLPPLERFDAPTPRIDAMIARRKRRTPTILPDLDEMTS